MPRTLERSGMTGFENELKLLCEISGEIQSSPATDDSFEGILKHLGKMVDFRSASLFLNSKISGKLEEICTIGRTVDLIDFVEFDMGFGISAWVAQKKRPIVLNNLRKSRAGSHTKSFLSVPMLFGGEITGVINLAHDEPDSFTERDVELVAIVATLMELLAERIANTKYESEFKDEIHSLNEKLKNTHIEMSKMEQIKAGGNLADTLNQQISNPLAIIAGNAQFLLMTMKNSNSSVLRRLKAIDKEASNILSIAQQFVSPSARSERRFTLKVGE